MQTDRYYFETKRHAGRRSQRKHPARVIDMEQREASVIRTMILEIRAAITSLDQGIHAEQERTGVHDPLNYAYSLSARSLSTRRDNLAMTLLALEERLARFKDAPVAEVAA